MHKAIDAFFELNKNSEVGEVANFCGVLRTYRILSLNVLPGIVLELLDAKRHLALVAVEGEDGGFYLVAYFEEVLSRTKVLAPRHFAYVNQTFYSRSDFNESSVVGHHDYFTFHYIANLELAVEGIPWMGLKLFQTEGNAFLLFIEVENNDIEFLSKLYDIVGIVHTTPAQVCDMYEAVYAAEVDKYTV